MKGIILKDKDGAPIDEIMGTGFKTNSREVTLGEHDELIGFFGTIGGDGQALLSLGLITYDTSKYTHD